MIKLLFILLPLYCISQTYIVDEQFTSTMPSGWSSTASGWVAHNYGVGNARSGAYALRLPSASNTNTKYLYVPITVKAGHSYLISFYTKRACSLTININETANQTTLLESTTHSNSNCNSNFSNWYNWSDVYVPTSDGVLYIQILIKTVYGGPTSVYLDDFRVLEQAPISLPIELLYFHGHNDNDSNILEWATASEYQNDYFTLYRSVNGYDWMSILVMSGAGTSSIKHEYQYSDVALSDIVYYVLKQTDTDGKFKIHHPISVYNPRTYKTVLRCTDLLGRVLENSTGQARIVEYTDGTKVIIVGNRF